MNFPLQYSGDRVFAEITVSFSKCLAYRRNFFSSGVFRGTGMKNISENSASIVLAGRSPIRHSLLNISPFNSPFDSPRIKIGASTMKFPWNFGRNVSRNLHRSPFRSAHWTWSDVTVGSRPSNHWIENAQEAVEKLLVSIRTNLSSNDSRFSIQNWSDSFEIKV